ncbi:MAG: isoprenylcysteine carboxylmethyltransferase family protein [Nanoarchaeota archaeon]
MGLKILPVIIFALLLLLSIGAHFLFPVFEAIPKPYNMLGLALIPLGLALTSWAGYLFHKTKTSLKPYEAPKFLVTSGPFQISRNPMYLGLVLVFLGTTITLGSLTPFLFPVLFMLIVELLFIPKEEKKLEKAFGTRYLDYKKEVKKWV